MDVQIPLSPFRENLQDEPPFSKWEVSVREISDSFV
jgi:hypothetical protein